MKKLSVIIFAMMMVMGAQAQVKVAPKLAKGNEATYNTKVSMNVPGVENEIVMNINATFSVVEETPDGFIIATKPNSFESNVKEDDFLGQVMTMAVEMANKLKTQLVANKEGKIVGIKDYDKLKAESETLINDMVDKVASKIPQEMAGMIPVDMLKQEAAEKISEKALVESMQNAGPFALNGRTIMTGAQEEYVGEQGMKMKRLYLLTSTDGKKIRTSGTLNMTKEEMKQMFIEQIEQSMPDQAEAVKQNIDMMMDSGMLKMEITDTSDYTLTDNQWVQSVTTTVVSSTMGQESKVTTTMELVDSKF